MISSRIANSVRVALPYASWAGYAIQLGYVGYNLYQYYQYYLAQVERDRQNGCERSLNDTIELVIKPRRKRRITQEGGEVPTNEQQQQSTTDDDDNNQQASQEKTHEQKTTTDETNAIVTEENTEDDTSETTRNISSDEVEATATNLDQGKDSSNDVTCVFDSRTGQENQQPTTSAVDQAHEGPEEEPFPPVVDDDVLSTTSTSLESTDSNKGIIHDIYSECFICARSLNDSRRPVASLPFCMHPFHQSCLDGVLKWHPKCPICDSNIFTPI